MLPIERWFPIPSPSWVSSLLGNSYVPGLQSMANPPSIVSKGRYTTQVLIIKRQHKLIERFQLQMGNITLFSSYLCGKLDGITILLQKDDYGYPKLGFQRVWEACQGSSPSSTQSMSYFSSKKDVEHSWQVASGTF